MDEHKLQSIPLFASFSAPQLRDLSQDADEVDVPEGKALRWSIDVDPVDLY